MPTKTIVKKKQKKQTKKAKTQKQKQKQTVSVNVNIDQSKRTQPRKPKSTSTASHLPTSMQSGYNYLGSQLPPVFYQPPANTYYGLQPVTNSNSE